MTRRDLFSRCIRVRRSFFFFSSRRRHTRCSRDWSSDVCSSDLVHRAEWISASRDSRGGGGFSPGCPLANRDRKSTRLNSSHGYISYAVFCLKKKKTKRPHIPFWTSSTRTTAFHPSCI